MRGFLSGIACILFALAALWCWVLADLCLTPAFYTLMGLALCCLTAHLIRSGVLK